MDSKVICQTLVNYLPENILTIRTDELDIRKLEGKKRGLKTTTGFSSIFLCLCLSENDSDTRVCHFLFDQNSPTCQGDTSLSRA